MGAGFAGIPGKARTLFALPILDPNYHLLEEQFAEPVPADIALGGLHAKTALLSPGPVNDKSFADEIAGIDEAPETAVMAVVPVVSHDEITVRRNYDRPEIIPCARHDVRIVEIAVGVVERFIIDVDFLVYYLNPLERQPYYSFDVILRTVVGILKYDNIKLFRRLDWYNLFIDNRDPDPVNEFVDKDMVPDQQSGLHGTGRNFESLDDKSADKKRKHYCYDNGFTIFADNAFAPDPVTRGFNYGFQQRLLSMCILA
jgi:hypothetical protein